MRATTARYREHLKRSHDIAVRIDVIDPNGTIKASTHEDGELGARLKVIGGQVRVSRSTRTRRSMTLELAVDNAGVVPGSADDIFSIVSGNRIKPYVGIRFPDGDEEMFSQGVFDITSSEVTDRIDEFSVRIEGADLTRRLTRVKFDVALVVAAGQNVVSAAQAIVIIGTIGGDIPDFRATSTGHVTPQLVWDEDVERWKAVEDLMFSIGFEAFFDADGDCVMQPQPDLTSLLLPFSDVIYVEGATPDFDEDFYPLLSLDTTTDSEEVVNRVVVIGESTSGGAPVRGEWIDNDPTSPTYVYGPYGKVSTTIRTPLITSAAQAADAAAAEGRRRKLPSQTLRLEVVPNPAHEETDLIVVIRERSKISEFYVVDGFTVPFTADQPMVLTTCPRSFA